MSEMSLQAMLDEEIAVAERMYYAALKQQAKHISAVKSRVAKEAALQRRKKKRRKRLNDKRHKMEKEQLLAERQKRIDAGDQYGYYRVLVVRNRLTHARLGSFRWLNEAQAVFQKSVEENRRSEDNKFSTSNSSNSHKVGYEILLVQSDPDGQPDCESVVRNETTLIYERNKVVGDKSVKILRKASWLVPETFSVVGYHPRKERKTARFIYETFIKPYGRTKEDMVTIGIWRRHIYIRRDDDINFATCPTKKVCYALYSFFRKQCRGKKHIHFLGECPATVAGDMRELFETKSASLS